MNFIKFRNERISEIGLGSCRLPLLDPYDETKIDIKKTEEIVDYAISSGINYIDTGYDYHWGRSEEVLGNILSKYDRSKIYIADKLPATDYETGYIPDINKIYNIQKKRLHTDYFDFYMCHGLRDNNLDFFKKNLDFIISKKEQGEVKYSGVSCHCSLNTLKDFLDFAGNKIDFVMSTLNWYDWFSNPTVKGTYDLLLQKNIKFWPMITLKAGRLIHLTEEEKNILSNYSLRTPLEWSSSFIKSFYKDKNIGVVVTGMSSIDQVKSNIESYSSDDSLTDLEIGALEKVVHYINDDFPFKCNHCNECINNCPSQLDIPRIITAYEQTTFHRGDREGIDLWKAFNLKDSDRFPENCEFGNCIKCKQCENVCSKNIPVTKIISELQKRDCKDFCDFYW